jgi:hypothetical protein
MTEPDGSLPSISGRKPVVWVATGAALLVLLAALGALALRRRADAPAPERLKQKVNALVKDLIQDRWAFMRKAVEQVGSDEGARALYRDQPGLASRIPTEAAFLKAASRWRRILEPLPEALPDLESRAVTYVNKPEGTEMSYRAAKGTVVFMKWTEDDRLVEMRVY